MIFACCGTQDKEFRRLFEEIERLLKLNIIKERVVAQIGNTKFQTDLEEDKMKIVKFTSPEEMHELIEYANLIITHGGVATIIEGLKQEKKIIAVPRLKKYKEHVNDHQLQIIENFSMNGYIIGTKEVKEIEQALKRVENFIPRKYESNNEKFLRKLEENIN